MNNRNPKTLILGNGYVAKKLMRYAPQDQIYTICSRETFDYANPERLRAFLEEEEFEAVVNCSGFTGKPNVEQCELKKEECFMGNVIIPMNITTACERADVPVIHVGSGCIYDGYDKEYTEQDLPNFGAACTHSSFYSKTKDIFEKTLTGAKYDQAFIFRIRIPFDGVYEPKNYLYKVLDYDTLISMPNSLTYMVDFSKFVWEFLNVRMFNEDLPSQIVNCTNPGYASAEEVVDRLRYVGLVNKNWKFVPYDKNTYPVRRSNCVLSTDYQKTLTKTFRPIDDALIDCRNVLQSA
jgi:dTDP-4-dehydrorhamnose reductase